MLSGFQAHAAECEPVFARLVSAQGPVEVLRASTSAWQAAPPDATVCAGDSVRVGPYGRAALRLANQSTLRLNQNTTLTVPSPKDDRPVIDLRRGAIHVLTRTPRPFTIRTPFVNAGVEGTEFLVDVGADATRLAVVEGKVVATNESGEILLRNDQSALARRGAAPEPELRLRPVDAVQWSLYYPSTVELEAFDADALKEADTLARSGQFAAAVARLEGTPASARSVRWHVYRADLLLRIGRADEAVAALDRAIALDPQAGDPHALRAIIDLVRNDAASALRESEVALRLSPGSATVLVAQSYVLQSRFDIAAARAAAERAAVQAPGNASVWARVAELRLAGGAFDDALDAARRAAALRPDLSRTQTVLGFAHLVRVDTASALRAFELAIERDPADYLPRLGRGIATIRRGALNEGREDIEIAAVLDPGNSLVRSYLGKAYHDEDRDRLAAVQFDLAKAFDPNDPTPWFYDAVQKQGNGRPGEALQDIQRSIALNGNRAVYRSKLLLDEDYAARNARLASVYGELGFDRLVLAEAYRSLSVDPEDFASHRLLADAFAGRPRHDVARVSEQLQAQLWQPVNLAPVGWQQFDQRPQYLLAAGLASPSHVDYDALFVRQGVSGQVSAVVGGHQTQGGQVQATALFGSTSFSASQYHYETDGFQSGWGFDKTAYGALVQHQWSPRGTAFVEVRKVDETFGDNNQNFYGPPTSQRNIERRELARFGARAGLLPGLSVAVVANYQHLDSASESPLGTLQFTDKARERSVEVLVPYRADRLQLLAGFGRYRAPGQLISGQEPTSDSVSRSSNAFAYASIEAVPDTLSIDLGASRDSVDAPDFPSRMASTNTKYGLAYRPGPGTVVRLAHVEAMRRSVVAEQTIEPTNVAGFNQFYNDSLGTRSRRNGVAVDHRFSPTMFAGLEASRRLQVIPQSFSADLEPARWTEREVHAYLYWLPSRTLSLSAEYHDERLTAEPLFAFQFLSARTQMLPLGAKWFWPERQVSVRLATTGIRQRGEFRVDPSAAEFAPGRTSFWLADLGIAIGLPRRHGELTLDIRNLFNRQFNFQETDVFTPTLARGRLALLRLSLAF